VCTASEVEAVSAATWFFSGATWSPCGNSRHRSPTRCVLFTTGVSFLTEAAERRGGGAAGRRGGVYARSKRCELAM
jgi:hypothetical protein